MASSAREEISRTAASLSLVALLAFVAVGHLAWLAADSSLSGYDELAFFDHLIKYRAFLQQEHMTHWLGFLDFSSYPALPFLAGLVAWRGGEGSVTVIRLTGVIFHLLWILSIYGIGHRLANRLTGLVAAGVIALSPLATILARHYASFLLHAALATFAVYILLRIKDASGAKGAAAAGLACSLALLSERGTPLLYLAGPILWIIVLRLRGANRRVRQRLVIDFVLFALIVVVIAGPYLLGYFRANLAHTMTLSKQAVIGGRGAQYYLDHLRGALVGPAFFPLLIFGIASGVARRDRRFMLPLLWLAIPLIVLSGLATKDMVYALSMTAPLALACGLGAAHLPRRFWRAPILLVLLLFAAVGWVRVGDPDLPFSRKTEHLHFLSLHDASVLPIDHPRRDLDAGRLLAAVRELHAKSDDIWAITGVSVKPDGSWARKDYGDSIRVLMLLHGVPGRYLLALNDLFPGRAAANSDDQCLVLAPASAARPGSVAAFLARPAFAPDEHLAVEPRLIQEWRNLELYPARVMGLASRRLLLYRATVPATTPAEGAGQSPPIAGAVSP